MKKPDHLTNEIRPELAHDNIALSPEEEAALAAINDGVRNRIKGIAPDQMI